MKRLLLLFMFLPQLTFAANCVPIADIEAALEKASKRTEKVDNSWRQGFQGNAWNEGIKRHADRVAQENADSQQIAAIAKEVKTKGSCKEK